jgi:hypothetical protein
MDCELEPRFLSNSEIQKAGYLGYLLQLLQINHYPNLDKEWSNVIPGFYAKTKYSSYV